MGRGCNGRFRAPQQAFTKSHLPSRCVVFERQPVPQWIPNLLQTDVDRCQCEADPVKGALGSELYTGVYGLEEAGCEDMKPQARAH
jgi:hypothetical protein